MDAFVLGEISTYCHQVKSGKPAAMLPLQERYSEEAKQLIESNGLCCYLDRYYPEWVTIWMYKKEDVYLLEIIKFLPQGPKTALDHWINGKLFGYSDEAIREFIKTQILV
jgi:hypothetical protein